MIKVEHTKTHVAIPQGKSMYHDVLVAPATLVLVPCKSGEALLFSLPNGFQYMLKLHYVDTLPHPVKWFIPIFISETEKIEVGDLSACYDCTTNEFVGIGTVEEIYENNIAWCSDHKERLNYQFICRKILSLPEHFSPQQLQMIVDGKLKDGGKVLIECEQSTVAAWAGPNMIRKHGSGIFGIKLNPHITIYPVEEKMVPLSEVRIIAEKAAKQAAFYGWYTPERFKEWFEQNVK